MTTKIKEFVSDVPVVSLELSSNVNVSDIKEGMDVFFECNVKSNPWIYRVSWQHNVSIKAFVIVQYLQLNILE